MTAKHQTIVNGIQYESLNAACRAHGLKISHIHHRMKKLGMMMDEAFAWVKPNKGACEYPEYVNYASMLYRCYNQKAGSYSSYGGKGIGVCDKWRNDFFAFFADMGAKPTASHTIDRIDSTKGYSKENCRWATPEEQKANNSRAQQFGPYPSISAAAMALGISKRSLFRRIDANIPADVVISLASQDLMKWRTLQEAIDLKNGDPPKCKKGHAKTEDNIYKHKNKAPRCRSCALLYAKTYRENKRSKENDVSSRG